MIKTSLAHNKLDPLVIDLIAFFSRYYCSSKSWSKISSFNQTKKVWRWQLLARILLDVFFYYFSMNIIRWAFIACICLCHSQVLTNPRDCYQTIKIQRKQQINQWGTFIENSICFHPKPCAMFHENWQLHRQ